MITKEYKFADHLMFSLVWFDILCVNGKLVPVDNESIVSLIHMNINWWFYVKNISIYPKNKKMQEANNEVNNYLNPTKQFTYCQN
jgi:hypothetical protein